MIAAEIEIKLQHNILHVKYEVKDWDNSIEKIR